MKKSKKKKLIKKQGDTVLIDRLELIKQLRRMNVKKSRTIEPKKKYDRKDKSWKKDI